MSERNLARGAPEHSINGFTLIYEFVALRRQPGTDDGRDSQMNPLHKETI